MIDNTKPNGFDVMNKKEQTNVAFSRRIPNSHSNPPIERGVSSSY
jgi:hypothetical protein